MGFLEVLLIGIALSMDACAVGMTNGMADSKMPFKRVLLIAAFFGFFQFLMPLIGYGITGIVANAFLNSFEKISAWISFLLLAFLGGKMLYEGIEEWIKERRRKASVCPCMPEAENVQTTGAGTDLLEKTAEKTLSFGKLFMQAIATSIDALAVGVTLQMAAISEAGLALGAFGSTGLIGLVTLGLSIGAVYIGKAVGDKLADKAEILGGVVLLGIGLKILIESFL